MVIFCGLARPKLGLGLEAVKVVFYVNMTGMVILFGNTTTIINTMTFSDGYCYTGGLDGLKKHGQGKETMPNGDTYEGQWQNDKANG